MATTSQILASLPACDPNKLEGTVREAIEKMVEKANLVIAMVSTGINPVGNVEFDRFTRLIAGLDGYVNKGGNKTPSPAGNIAMPNMGGTITNNPGIATPQPAFDEKGLDDEVMTWAQNASQIKKLKTYRYLNIEGIRMNTIDYEITQEIQKIKGQP
jgi:hypothetical protein